jgi:phosphatidylinositol alpha-mannosyltransferase
MKRGAIITFDFYPPIGGQGRHTYELWRRLQNEPDLDLMVLSPLVNALPNHERVFGLTLRFGRHLAFSLAATAWLDHWRRRYALDFVHLNGGPGGMFLLRRSRASVLYTVHHTYAQQSRLVPGQAWKGAFVPLERASYAKADLVTGDCASTTAALRNELGIADAFTVPSGVDTNRFRALDLERIPDSLLFVGRLDARKGIEHVVRAMPRLIEQAPGARLYVIGLGPLEAKLRAMLDHGRYEDRVQFLGRVSEDELVGWYNRASLVVVPSAFEGFGLAVLEAQACGAPVLATETDGLRDLIQDGVTGRLTRYGNTDALADLAAELLRDGEQRRALAEAGLRQARSFDWDVVIQRWREVYRRLPEAASLEALEALA